MLQKQMNRHKTAILWSGSDKLYKLLLGWLQTVKDVNQTKSPVHHTEGSNLCLQLLEPISNDA